MDPILSYELLRSFTTPVVAITAERDGKRNGMISDAAARASIVPDVPRLMILVHKFNYTHDMIFETGRFAVHALHRAQLELVERLGFESGRDRDKLADVPHRLGTLGCPILEDCWAWFECRVINVMDTGSSTCFLGDVVELGRGPGKEILTPGYMRANLPEGLREIYLTKLAAAQTWARERSGDVRAVVWRDLERPRPKP
ncbi:MAG TPA: flavin reductase family protein [Gemmatimonadales bacterium]|nr:flavin reductase family protein [Gemmatimonadales bacterium]